MRGWLGRDGESGAFCNTCRAHPTPVHCGQESTDNATALKTSNICNKRCHIIIFRTITNYVLFIYVPMQMAIILQFIANVTAGPGIASRRFIFSAII